MTTLPLHAPLVDPKTGMVNMTSPWLPILRASGGLSAEQVNGLSALQFKALLASVQVGGVGGIPISQGAITAEMIGSISANTINGNITADQIGSVNANTINGNISANQIGSVNAVSIAGNISADQIGSINATSITGSITAGQIGSINAGVISSGQITTAGVVNCASLTGTIGSAVTVNAATVTIAGGWSGGQIATATITGSNIAAATIVYGNIATVNAGAIVAVGGSAISATCIDTLNAGSITVVGGWSSGQIGSVNAGTINAGTIDGAVIGILNAGSISITGTGWVHGQIASIDAGTITIGTLNAIDITGCTITGGTFETSVGIGSGQAGIIMTNLSNQAVYWGLNHVGASVNEVLATIGVNSIGSSVSCATFGSLTSGNTRLGIGGLSDSNPGGYFQSNSGNAIVCISSSANGVNSASTSSYGVYGQSSTSVGIYGIGAVGGHFSANSSSGNALTMAQSFTGSQTISDGATWTPAIGFYTFAVDSTDVWMQGPGGYSVGCVPAGTFYTNGADILFRNNNGGGVTRHVSWIRY